MKTHSNDPKLHCIHCNAPYTSRHALVQHQKSCSMNMEPKTKQRKEDEEEEEKRGGNFPSSSSISKKSPLVITLKRIKLETKEHDDDDAKIKSDGNTGNDRPGNTGKGGAVTITVLNPAVTAAIPTRSSARRKAREAAAAAAAKNAEDITGNGGAPGYIPDNNSNNVISKTDIEPAPSGPEQKQGFCQRRLSNGQSRLICIDCGKHYTTMYNMRQHRNIHTGHGLHTCRFCGKSFTHKHIWEVCCRDSY